MGIKRIVANDIWRAREEVFLEGNPEHDWWLAGLFLDEHGDEHFDYEDIYIWVMELPEHLADRSNNGIEG